MFPQKLTAWKRHRDSAWHRFLAAPSGQKVFRYFHVSSDLAPYIKGWPEFRRCPSYEYTRGLNIRLTPQYQHWIPFLVLTIVHHAWDDYH